jgi:hypothetical protein
MAATLSFDRLRSILVATVTHLPDTRTRPNRIYEMADAALGAFGVFCVQSPSFLAHQRDMQRVRGQNNTQSLFGVEQVPSDGQIRNLLDPIAPEQLAQPFWRVFEQLRDGNYLAAYQGHPGQWLCALDGTQYFSGLKPARARQRAPRTHACRTGSGYSGSLAVPCSAIPVSLGGRPWSTIRIPASWRAWLTKPGPPARMCRSCLELVRQAVDISGRNFAQRISDESD